MSLLKSLKTKLHGQARNISPLTAKPAGLAVERSPAPKTIVRPRINPWSSGARINKKEKTAQKSATREKTDEIKVEPKKTERLNPKKGGTSCLKRPVRSEKATAISKNNQYVFLVDNNANKNEVRKDVENRYNVKVIKVNIIKYKGKPKRWAAKINPHGRHKKAVVTLGQGFKIDLSV